MFRLNARISQFRRIYFLQIHLNQCLSYSNEHEIVPGPTQSRLGISRDRPYTIWNSSENCLFVHLPRILRPSGDGLLQCFLQITEFILVEFFQKKMSISSKNRWNRKVFFFFQFSVCLASIWLAGRFWEKKSCQCCTDPQLWTFVRRLGDRRWQTCRCGPHCL